MSRATRVVLLVVAMAVTLAVSAAPGYAAGETFQVVSVSATGCASGDFRMTVERAGLDGGSYTVHTVVTVEGLVYMNENATISVNGQTNWSLFDNFSYGAVPNQGTWPIPPNKRLRMNFTLERPLGTVLYAWSTSVDGCNSGNILLNGLTSDDKDGDAVPLSKDKCPKLAGTLAKGCPFRARSLTIAYDRGSRRFIGWLYAKGYSKLYSRRTVTIWKVRPGPDKKVGTVRTTTRGNYSLARARHRGTYYAVSKALLVPSAGQARKETSLKLRLR